MDYNIRLLVSCPDQKGIIAALSSFITVHDGNILSAYEYVSPSEGGSFFMRLEIEGEGFSLERREFNPAFTPLAHKYEMDWRVSYTDRLKRLAILVSKQDHCFIDLLWRWKAGELVVDIPPGDLQPPRSWSTSEVARYTFLSPASYENNEGGAGGTYSGPVSPAQYRIGCAGPLHADTLTAFRAWLPESDNKHTPLLLTGVCGSRSLPASL